jgi:hypothetical protein
MLHTPNHLSRFHPKFLSLDETLLGEGAKGQKATDNEYQKEIDKGVCTCIWGGEGGEGGDESTLITSTVRTAEVLMVW